MGMHTIDTEVYQQNNMLRLSLIKLQHQGYVMGDRPSCYCGRTIAGLMCPKSATFFHIPRAFVMASWYTPFRLDA